MTKVQAIHWSGILTIIGAGVSLAYYVFSFTSHQFLLARWSLVTFLLGELLVVGGVVGLLLAQRSWFGRIVAVVTVLEMLANLWLTFLEVFGRWFDHSSLGLLTLLYTYSADLIFLIGMVIVGIVTLEQQLLGKLSIAPLLVGLLVSIGQNFQLIALFLGLLAARIGDASNSIGSSSYRSPILLIQASVVALVWVIFGLALLNYQSAPQLVAEDRR